MTKNKSPITFFLIFFWLFSCGRRPERELLHTGPSCSKLDPSKRGEFYTSESNPLAPQLIEVNIEMNHREWAQLRQDRPISRCDHQHQYRWFSAQIKINDRFFKNIGIRKKSVCGSLSAQKPALKIKLNKYQQKQIFFSGAESITDLTLNNSKQDPGLLRQCLGYQWAREKGLAASRCQLAKVCVNEEFIGLYVNVEPIKKSFLKHNFSNASGALFEGNYGDLIEDKLHGLENKRHPQSYAEISPLVEKLTRLQQNLKSSPGKQKLITMTSLDDLDDLDEVNWDNLIMYMAFEMAINHFDGVGLYLNNYYLYNAQEGLSYIPWGIDQTFQLLEHELKITQRKEAILFQIVHSHPKLQRQLTDQLIKYRLRPSEISKIIDQLKQVKKFLSPYILPWEKAQHQASFKQLLQFFDYYPKFLEIQIEALSQE